MLPSFVLPPKTISREALARLIAQRPASDRLVTLVGPVEIRLSPRAP